MEKINASYRTLRRLLGELGILLPWLLYFRNELNWETSISDFYYTPASSIFTGVMIALGLFLFTYRGHPIDNDKNEWISDNALTNIGGFMAILTALIPTTCSDGVSCHFNGSIGTIHLVCAAMFLAIMGGVVFFKFTLSPNRKWYFLYKASGIIVWASLVGIGIYLWLKKEGDFEYGVLVGEIIALTAFGIAWLVKGRVNEMLLLNTFKKKN